MRTWEHVQTVVALMEVYKDMFADPDEDDMGMDEYGELVDHEPKPDNYHFRMIGIREDVREHE